MAITEFTGLYYQALAADTKPAGARDGSLLEETDTNRVFLKSEAGWVPFASTSPYQQVTAASYTPAVTDLIIGVNRAGAVEIILPTAGVIAGKRYIVKDESGAAAANNVTVSTQGAELIDGAATHVISTNYGSQGFYCNGTNWFKV